MNNKEEVINLNNSEAPVTPKQTVYSSAPIKEVKPVMESITPQPEYKPAMDNLGPVDAEANKPKEAAPVYHPAMDDLGPVDAENSTVFTPKIESLTPSMDVNTAIKETQSATPNKMDDPALKIEDTMLSNNLKEDIKKVQEMTPEESKKDSNKKLTWLIAILVIIGLAIFLLPLFVKF